jgi:hypothetical protein
LPAVTALAAAGAHIGTDNLCGALVRDRRWHRDPFHRSSAIPNCAVRWVSSDGELKIAIAWAHHADPAAQVTVVLMGARRIRHIAEPDRWTADYRRALRLSALTVCGFAWRLMLDLQRIPPLQAGR